MKIVFITRENKQMPAVKVRCYGFAKYLNAAGIEAEVFSYADDLGAKTGELEGQMSLIEKIGYNLKAFRYLLKKDAVLVVQRCNYHSFAPLLLNMLGKKMIFDLDDWEARENSEYYFNTIPKSKAEMMMRVIAKNSILNIGASDLLVAYLSKYSDKVIYLPTAVDTELFKPAAKAKSDNGIILSWLGTMYRKDNLENIEFLIDCFLELEQAYSNIKLEILGQGTYYDKLLEKVQANPKIIVKPWIAPEDVPAYIQDIDIGVMPLIQNTKFNLAKSPTRLFEYMAMAKPVVVSGTGEAKRIIEQGVNGFIADSKHEFVSRLKELIENRDLREDLGKNARNTIEEKFSLKIITNQLIEKLAKI